MTDFNKGDFTQQGVDGHVNAKLRLNAKRYLDIDLTSNEQASGCTISGHVYDSLNDITYPIGSAPSGNIEITENTAEGSPLNIAQYATATVNVPSSGGLDNLKTTVTITNNVISEDSFNFMDIIGGDSYALISSDSDYYITLEPIMTYAGETLAYGQSIEQDWYYNAKANPFEVIFLKVDEACVNITANNMTRVENNGTVGYMVTDMTANSSFDIIVNSIPK